MAITIYGSPHSRTMRVLWLAEELGLDYQHYPYEFNDPALKQPAFLALNPAGAIPTLVEQTAAGEFALSESLAINLYLAKKYGRTLYPRTAEDEASAIRWSLFAQGHLEPWVQKDAMLAELIQTIGNLAQGMIHQSLQTLNRVLSKSSWLIGDTFTVADLNVAGVLSPSRSRGLDLDNFAEVNAWLARCYSRPAAVAARARFSP